MSSTGALYSIGETSSKQIHILHTITFWFQIDPKLFCATFWTDNLAVSTHRQLLELFLVIHLLPSNEVLANCSLGANRLFKANEWVVFMVLASWPYVYVGTRISHTCDFKDPGETCSNQIRTAWVVLVDISAWSNVWRLVLNLRTTTVISSVLFFLFMYFDICHFDKVYICRLDIDDYMLQLTDFGWNSIHQRQLNTPHFTEKNFICLPFI